MIASVQAPAPAAPASAPPSLTYAQATSPASDPSPVPTTVPSSASFSPNLAGQAPQGLPSSVARVATGAKRVRSEDAPLPQEAHYAPISLPVGRFQALADKIRTKQDAEAAARDRLASIFLTMADNCLASMAPHAEAFASTRQIVNDLASILENGLVAVMTGSPLAPPTGAATNTSLPPAAQPVPPAPNTAPAPAPAPPKAQPAHHPSAAAPAAPTESSDKESWSTVARKGKKASKATQPAAPSTGAPKAKQGNPSSAPKTAPTDNRLFVVVPTDSPLRKLSPAYIVTKANAGIPRGEGAGTATATKTGFALTAVRDVGKFLSHAERIRANLTAEKVHKRDAWSKYIVHGLPTSITVEDPKTPGAVMLHRVTLDDVRQDIEQAFGVVSASATLSKYVGKAGVPTFRAHIAFHEGLVSPSAVPRRVATLGELHMVSADNTLERFPFCTRCRVRHFDRKCPADTETQSSTPAAAAQGDKAPSPASSQAPSTAVTSAPPARPSSQTKSPSSSQASPSPASSAPSQPSTAPSQAAQLQPSPLPTSSESPETRDSMQVDDNDEELL
ncbi:uncharacterized protein BROUX77_002025 [Berkeleyomyces rouxiae]|uniref:uncharacterized protein n=1 Tax=Berkeleyomyces rouxiae TaxID=2035830 RepID=UPI003B7BE02B